MNFNPITTAAALAFQDCPLMERTRLTASAVALTLVTRTGLPSSSTTDPEGHFVSQVLPVLRQQFSEVNEAVPFDTAFAATLARQLWLVRYHAAYPSLSLISSLQWTDGKTDWLARWLQVGVHTSQENLDSLSKHANAIFCGVGKLNDLIERNLQEQKRG